MSEINLDDDDDDDKTVVCRVTNQQTVECLLHIGGLHVWPVFRFKIPVLYTVSEKKVNH